MCLTCPSKGHRVLSFDLMQRMSTVVLRKTSSASEINELVDRYLIFGSYERECISSLLFAPASLFRT